MSKPKIITLDIETAPNIAHVWGIWQQNVGLNQIVSDEFIMSYAYKELHDDWIYYEDNRGDSDKEITKALIKVLDKADIVVGHNVGKFDLRWITGRAIMYGLKPPSPYKIIDTLLEARKSMRLVSYRLDFLSKKLGVAAKSSHAKFPGHALWLECLRGNDEAWDEMELYNIQDVETTEEVYLKLRPYMKNHPNLGVYMEGDDTVCGRCGSSHIHFRGYFYTNTGKYRKFQCAEEDCGGWGSLRHTEYPKDKRKKLGKNVG